MAIRSSGVKYCRRIRNNPFWGLVLTYPCLRTGTDTRIDQGRSTGGRIGLGVEAKVRSKKLNTLVVPLLDDPLLASRRLLVVRIVASCQCYRGSAVRVGHLAIRRHVISLLYRSAEHVAYCKALSVIGELLDRRSERGLCQSSKDREKGCGGVHGEKGSILFCDSRLEAEDDLGALSV